MPTLLDVATELYALAPGGFVTARESRAAELRSADEPELARQVRALRKPSTAAWVVNHLVRADPDQVQQVVDLGAAMRAAQEGMDGDQLRELTRQRRQLTAAVTTRARALAAEAGTRVSDAVATQVEATLTAAMIDDEAGRAVRAGVLVGALEATGVDPADVASVVAAPQELGIEPHPDGRRRHLHAVPDAPGTGGAARRSAPERRPLAAEREAQREQVRRAVADAADDLAAAEREHVAASDDVARIEAAAQRLDAERDAVRRRLAALDDEAQTVEAELRGAALRRERAERARDEATRRRDEADARLSGLEPGGG